VPLLEVERHWESAEAVNRHCAFFGDLKAQGAARRQAALQFPYPWRHLFRSQIIICLIGMLMSPHMFCIRPVPFSIVARAIRTFPSLLDFSVSTGTCVQLSLLGTGLQDPPCLRR